MASRPFSSELKDWLKSHEPKTLERLGVAFEEKSFATLILLLMAIPALPLPTGGITHIFEIVTMLLALELIIGRRTIWIPKRWRHLKLGNATETKAIPYIIRRIKWFERYAKPRLGELLAHPLFIRMAGIIIFLLALGAFLAPPFSGLDTLPSLGVVVICLALILEDAALFLAGLLLGALGVGLEIGFSSLMIHFIRSHIGNNKLV
jgi:hypothetical protein